MVRFWLIAIFFIILFFCWLWFWETNAIKTRTTRIETGWEGRYILVSDLHVGMWKKEGYVRKVVTKLNAIPGVEAIFVAGDWVFHPKDEQLTTLFSPLKDLIAPVYGTLGNHDWGLPGPDLGKELGKRLAESGVTLIDGKSVQVGDVTVVGLPDAWKDLAGTSILNESSSTKKRIVIAHNPDSVLTFPNIPSLTLSGHTHCGQIRIPWLYKFFLPIESEYEKGYYETPKGKLYVTCGLGEVSIPLRLWNRPTIDIIETF
jgi:predicted MPP superfamily phosphohydrolase